MASPGEVRAHGLEGFGKSSTLSLWSASSHYCSSYPTEILYPLTSVFPIIVLSLLFYLLEILHMSYGFVFLCLAYLMPTEFMLLQMTVFPF